MKKGNIRFTVFITTLASLLIGFVCFAVLVLSYTLVRENVNNKEGIFFWGYKPIIIISDSMEPLMKVNGVSLLKKEDKIANVNIGDIIMFSTETHGLVMHRVLDKDSMGIITKGDNNEYPDNWRVTDADLKGKVIKTYNIVADFITFLFGDLVHINTGHLVFGFGVLTTFIVMLVVLLNTLYENLKTFIDVLWFGFGVLLDNNEYLKDRPNEYEMDDLLDVVGCKIKSLEKLKLFYYTLLLHDRFKKDEDNAKHTRKVYNKAIKIVNKIENRDK